jgi:hypothetical protein
MVTYKSIDDDGHMVEWYCARVELVKAHEPHEMQCRLEEWNRELRKKRARAAIRLGD